MSVLKKFVKAAKEKTPQELIFLGFIGSLGAARGWRLLKKSLNKESNSGEGSDTVQKVRVVGGKTFTQTDDDEGATTGLDISAAFPFWLPIIVRLFDLVRVIRDGAAGLGGGHTAFGRFKREIWVIFALLPFIEHMTAKDWANPTDKQVKEHPLRDWRFRVPLFLWTIIEIVSTALTLGIVCDPKAKLRIRDRLGATLMLGIFNGALGITYAHELLHKRDFLGKLAGNALLANVCYVHWADEHTIGHHNNVSTPDDPASARLGQSVYEFIPQTLIGTLKSAWSLEKKRLDKDGKPRWWLTHRNKVLSGFIASLVWALCIAKMTKRRVPSILGAFALQSAAGVLLLEWVNYIEHYGLARKKLPGGGYEPVDPTHSWNSPHRLSNTLLLKLQRHSDHHTFANRPYELLRNFKESPQLPTGYTGMIPLACFPSVFKWVMDPLVKAYQEGDGDQGTVEAEGKLKKLSAVWVGLFAVLINLLPE